MRNKFRVGAVVVLLLAVASITGASASSSSPNSTAREDDNVEVISVTSVETQSKFLDLGERGDSLGDQFVFSGNLFRRGEKVGTDGGVATIVRLQPRVLATLQFVATAVLPGGQITVQGLVTFTDGPSTYRLAITGGTGRYRTADGVLIVEERETDARLTFRIDR
jgi:hypothetical protein